MRGARVTEAADSGARPGDQLALFAELDDAGRRRLGDLALRRSFAAGEAIIAEGEYGESLYVLESGRVTVQARSGAQLDELTAGRLDAFFGEMCLLDLEPRSATVKALETTIVWEIHRDDLYWLFGDDRPLQRQILLTIAKALSRRLHRSG